MYGPNYNVVLEWLASSRKAAAGRKRPCSMVSALVHAIRNHKCNDFLAFCDVYIKLGHNATTQVDDT